MVDRGLYYVITAGRRGVKGCHVELNSVGRLRVASLHALLARSHERSLTRDERKIADWRQHCSAFIERIIRAFHGWARCQERLEPSEPLCSSMPDKWMRAMPSCRSLRAGRDNSVVANGPIQSTNISNLCSVIKLASARAQATYAAVVLEA